MNIWKYSKSLTKEVLKLVAPDLAEKIESVSHRRHIRQFEKSMGVDLLVDRFLREHTCKVHDGPFSGMRYVAKASGSALLPKLLGTYEQELNAAVEEAIDRAPVIIVDVGCAEGYYAVGLARRLPQAVVFGYDIDTMAKKTCRELAQINHVDHRIRVLGRCDHAELALRIGLKTLLVCDCEGFEWQLLDVEQVPSLASVDMIVELHGYCDEECKRDIETRFNVTHVLQFIAAEPRAGEVNAVIQDWSDADQALARNELRTDGHLWVWAKAKSA